ncbi:Peroxidase 73 precursor [Zea mays]|uniref:Peroxidase n=1 Tax=Zea mays TaxID=4577 RepID=B4FYD8_MAIZE|nr:Peroxidase 73 precursor [Zea mays]ACF87131.1 unknown [Zea mays]AQK62677.1 Peroxidase 16 [Zea mays]
MARPRPSVVVLAVAVAVASLAQPGAADLKQDYYASTCPNVEAIVRGVVQQRLQATIRAVGSTVRLFFHDCFVEGCDGSVLIESTPGNQAEKDASDNKSLASEGFDTVRSAKAAVEAACPDTVSCADVLAIAARDAISMSGGPFFPVELGRLDGLISTASSVPGQLPEANQTMDQLLAVFKAHGLNMSDLVALSAAHSVGLAHCSKFASRLYSYQLPGQPTDPTLNPKYARFLESRCPDGGPDNLVLMDQATPAQFDNQYYRNLQDGGGLLGSDQLLYTDNRTRPMVDSLANSTAAFYRALADAVVRLGRVGVKSGRRGNVRKQCDVFN